MRWMRFHTRRLPFTTAEVERSSLYRGNMLFLIFYFLTRPSPSSPVVPASAGGAEAEGSRRKACSIYTRRFSIFRLSIIHCGQPSLVLLLRASCAGAARGAPTAFSTSSSLSLSLSLFLSLSLTLSAFSRPRSRNWRNNERALLAGDREHRGSYRSVIVIRNMIDRSSTRRDGFTVA